MPDFHSLALSTNFIVLVSSAIVVWGAGIRLARYTDGIAEATGMGRALAGFLLLGGITSLPELSSSLTAAYRGYGTLAISGLLGSVAINVLLLAFADVLIGRKALTSVIAHPATLLQGMLGILLLGVVLAGIIVGEVELSGVGLWSMSLAPLFFFAVWLSSHQENDPSWVPIGHASQPEAVTVANEEGISSSRPELMPLVTRTVVAGLVILVAGIFLAETGAAVAEKTGLGTGLVGFALIGLSTSLPEISSVVGAVRLRRYELAFGDIFGTNLFDLFIIPIADLAYHGPILASAGRFEAIAATVGIIMTAIYVIGLLNRRAVTLLRFGYDSLAVMIVFVGGLLVLNAARAL